MGAAAQMHWEASRGLCLSGCCLVSEPILHMHMDVPYRILLTRDSGRSGLFPEKSQALAVGAGAWTPTQELVG